MTTFGILAIAAIFIASVLFSTKKPLLVIIFNYAVLFALNLQKYSLWTSIQNLAITIAATFVLAKILGFVVKAWKNRNS